MIPGPRTRGSFGIKHAKLSKYLAQKLQVRSFHYDAASIQKKIKKVKTTSM